MRQDMTDDMLMQRVAAGEHLAFRLLVERHATKARAVARRLLFGSSEADDIVQEVFTRLWVHAAGWDADKAKFTTWFYRLLTNACIDYRRKKKPAYLDEGPILEDTRESVETVMIGGQLAEQVKTAMSGLPERQQVALTLCYFEGFSNQMAAETMNIHLKALEGLLSRGRAQLKQTLQPLKRKGAI